MSKRQQAFVILTPGFPSSEKDSTCLPMQQQFVNTLASEYQDIKPVVLSFQYPYHQNEYKWNGITVIPFDGRNKGGVQRLLLRKKVLNTLNQLQSKYQLVGLLSFWLGECALVAKRFGEKNNIKHLCWISGQDARANNKYANRVAPAPGDLVALSDFLQEAFQKNHGVRPQHIVLPGIHSNGTFDRTRDIDILGVGSLIPLKQFDIFIETVAAIKKQIPTAKFVLAGEGPEKERLEKMAVQFGLNHNLQMIGEVAHYEVLDLMARAKILLHPSSYEGFSGVCVEALSRGAHVISFCRAMNKDINHWHIVGNKTEMLETTLKLLQENLDHQPVIVSDMKETVRKMMHLYELKPA